MSSISLMVNNHGVVLYIPKWILIFMLPFGWQLLFSVSRMWHLLPKKRIMIGTTRISSDLFWRTFVNLFSWTLFEIQILCVLLTKWLQFIFLSWYPPLVSQDEEVAVDFSYRRLMLRVLMTTELSQVKVNSKCTIRDAMRYKSLSNLSSVMCSKFWLARMDKQNALWFKVRLNCSFDHFLIDKKNYRWIQDSCCEN